MFKGVIEKLSKIASLDVDYFLRNSFWISVRYVVIGLAGLFISIGFTRLGTKELLGQYQFILNFLALASVFSLPGLNMVALKGVAQGEDGIIKKVISVSFLYSLLAVPIVFGYGLYQLTHENSAIGKTMILASILFPFFYAPNTWYTFFEGKSLFKKASLRIMLNNIFLAGAMVSVLFFKAGLFWVVFAFLFVNVSMNWIFYLEIFKKTGNFTKKLDMRYGLSCTLQKFTYSLSDAVPVLIISFIFGFQLLAIYQIAYLLIALLIGFISALAAIYMPLLFKYKEINYFKIVWQNLLIGLIFFVGLVVFIKFFFILFYGESYRESYSLSILLSFIIILIPLRVFLASYFTSISKNKIIIISNIFANIVSLIILFAIKSTGFKASVIVYFYSLNLLIIIPLFVSYLLIASKKMDSILSEIS
jgi:O-antigen/teichoic acid export membrane protein